jgi:hypothetical protein
MLYCDVKMTLTFYQSSLMESTGPNRTGDKLYEAHKITTSQTVYINNLLNGCTNESSFKIEIRQLPKLTIITDITSCQPYEIPKGFWWNFLYRTSRKRYKNSSGTIISKTQTIYLFNQWSDLKGCSTENPIAINIIGIVVDKKNDVNACDSYTLPIQPLENTTRYLAGKATN